MDETPPELQQQLESWPFAQEHSWLWAYWADAYWLEESRVGPVRVEFYSGFQPEGGFTIFRLRVEGDKPSTRVYLSAEEALDAARRWAEQL